MHEAHVAYSAGRLPEQAEMHDVQEAPCSGRSEIHAEQPLASKQAKKRAHGMSLKYTPAQPTATAGKTR